MIYDLRFMMLVFGLSMLASCGENPSSKREIGKSISGQDVYAKHCTMCHGDDGKKGLSGANDLSISALNSEETVKIVKMGKGGMAGYKHVLSEEEIEAVLEHIQALKKNSSN